MKNHNLSVPMSLKVSFTQKTKFVNVKGELGCSGLIPLKSIVSVKDLIINATHDYPFSRPLEKRSETISIEDIKDLLISNEDATISESTFMAKELCLLGSIDGELSMEFSGHWTC